jgi:hypothetical protein
MKDQFITAIQSGYTFKGPSINLGVAMLEGAGIPNLLVKAPLKTFNRHGLIAGATGTGKNKDLASNCGRTFKQWCWRFVDGRKRRF